MNPITKKIMETPETIEKLEKRLANTKLIEFIQAIVQEKKLSIFYMAIHIIVLTLLRLERKLNCSRCVIQ